MLDIAMVDTSLEVKRRDLSARIVEGRRAIATLVERHSEMGRRIEMANEAVRDLERKLAATNTVMDLYEKEGLILSVDPLARPAPAPAPVEVEVEVTAHVVSYPARKPEPFRPMTFLRCLTDGHDMVMSRSVSGMATCRRCKMRRPT